MFWNYGIGNSTSSLDSLLARISISTPSSPSSSSSSQSPSKQYHPEDSSSHLEHLHTQSSIEGDDIHTSPIGALSEPNSPSITGASGSDEHSSHGVGSGGADSSGSGVPLGPPSIEELLDEADLLSEVKSRNEKLMRFLATKDSLRSLLSWVTYGLEEIDERARQRLEEAEEKLALLEKQRDARTRNIAGGGSDSKEIDTDTVIGPDGKEAVVVPASEKQSRLSDTDDSAPRLQGDSLYPPQRSTQSKGSETSNTTSVITDSAGEAKRARYPQIATEILCSDVWSITEGLLDNLDSLMSVFWNRVVPDQHALLYTTMANGRGHLFQGEAKQGVSGGQVDNRERQRRADLNTLMEHNVTEQVENDGKRLEEIRGHWMRINTLLLNKRGPEMIAFIKSIPNAVERIMDRIDSPAIQDMLLRIVASEEQGVTGTIEWLSSEGLAARLLDQLSPYETPVTQALICDLIKSIISLSALTPFNPQGGNADEQQGGIGEGEGGANNGVDANGEPRPAGHRDNILARELVGQECSDTLTSYIFTDVQAGNSLLDQPEAEQDSKPYSFDPNAIIPLPSNASLTSSMTNSITVVIELIRKNNSDYSEPHLFHTLRNRLILAQQKRMVDHGRELGEDTGSDEEQNRADTEHLEKVMAESSLHMGIVHLGLLLEQFVKSMPKLQEIIKHPRSISIARTPNVPEPLTVERFRIIELYAELLHCSNMTILNRLPGDGPNYSRDGLLTGGLNGLEALGAALENDNFSEETAEPKQEEVAQQNPIEPVDESTEDTGPITAPLSPKLSESDDVPPPPCEADEERLRDVMTHNPRIRAIANEQPTTSSNVSEMGSGSNIAVASATSIDLEQDGDILLPTLETSVPSSIDPEQDQDDPLTTSDTSAPLTVSLGSSLKQAFIQTGVLPTVIDLFFDYPNNNFLHNVVYDVVQQLLNGRIGPGYNRDLIIALFNEARIVERILDAQRADDAIESRKKGMRMPHMGHLMLIADEVVKFLHRCPPEVLAEIDDSYIASEWEAFENGPFADTRARDSKPLGGGRPPISQSGTFANGLESEDESDSSDEEEGEEISEALAGQPLTRAMSSGTAFNSSFGFGSAEGEEGGSRPNEFSRYLMHEAHGRTASSDEDSDDSAGSPHMFPITGASKRRSESFEDSFNGTGHQGFSDGDDDDAWGEFASAPGDHAGEDPFGDPFEPSTSTSTRVQPQRTTTSTFNRHPFTSADFAEDAFRRQMAQEDNDFGDTPHIDQIETPATGDDSFESAAHFLASNWSIPGGDVDKVCLGEELPPGQTSPLSIFKRNSEDEVRSSPVTSPTSPMQRIPSWQSGPSLIPSPRRPDRDFLDSAIASGSDSGSVSSSPEASRGLHPAAKIGRHRRHSSLSSPDPSLIYATSPDQPLGLGVDPIHTRVREDGMLVRTMDGKEVAVPQDDITLAATHARRSSFSSQGSRGSRGSHGSQGRPDVRSP